MSITNKSELTLGIAKQYHIDLSKNDVGGYALLPGDPARSDIVAKYLDDAVLVGHKREHKSFSGFYKGIKVTVCSTGMGCPSAAIAMEELANIGVHTFIRIGSSAALKPDIKIGDLIINTASMKNEGTSKFYVPDNFPAVADLDVTHALIQTAREMLADTDIGVHWGIGATDDAFYGETPEWFDDLVKLGVMNVEMEASALYTIGHKRNLRAACICAASMNHVNQEFIEGENVRLKQGWEEEIKVVLETIYRLEQQAKN